MHPDFWHERWQKNQIGFHQGEINLHLQQFWSKLNVAPGSRVFVPLCGKSGDMLWLRAQGYEVVGVELSPLAVQAFFAENDLQATICTQGSFSLYEADGIRIYCGDFFDLNADDLTGLSAVYDRASLIALPPETRKEYVSHLCKLFPAGSHMLLVTLDYPQLEMDGPPFAVSDQEVRWLYEGKGRIEQLASCDRLAENEKFRERGITGLYENVYLIELSG